MSAEIIMLPMVLAAGGYILYTLRSYLISILFVSMTIEELGSFMEVTMDMLKECVCNKNWIVGRYSLIKHSAENIKLLKEQEAFGLDTGFYIGLFKRKPFVAIIEEKVLNGYGDWV